MKVGLLLLPDNVKEGKPSPEGYLLGRQKLDVFDPTYQIVVFEDSGAAAGVRAGKAAGATVIAVLETHAREELVATGADYIVEGLDKVRISSECNGQLTLHL